MVQIHEDRPTIERIRPVENSGNYHLLHPVHGVSWLTENTDEKLEQTRTRKELSVRHWEKVRETWKYGGKTKGKYFMNLFGSCLSSARTASKNGISASTRNMWGGTEKEKPRRGMFPKFQCILPFLFSWIMGLEFEQKGETMPLLPGIGFYRNSGRKIYAIRIIHWSFEFMVVPIIIYSLNPLCQVYSTRLKAQPCCEISVYLPMHMLLVLPRT